jgi:hypothetical protein
MAKFRYVHCNFWRDTDVFDFTPEEKFFYIYLITNEHTTQCGIYEVSIRQIEIETGYNKETIEKLIERFQKTYKKIKFNPKTRELAIKNWPRYNITSSPAVIVCAETELEKVKDKSLVTYIYGPNKENRVANTVKKSRIGYSDGKETLLVPYDKEKEKEKEKEKQKKEKKSLNEEGTYDGILL